MGEVGMQLRDGDEGVCSHFISSLINLLSRAVFNYIGRPRAMKESKWNNDS